MEMQRFEILTNLPSRLSYTIMQEWLTLKIVIFLDSAFCCRFHRGCFTDLVRSDEYNIYEQVTMTKQSKFMSALHRFGEKLRSVVISWTVSPRQEELLQNCHNLTHVRFQDYSACTHKLVRLLNDRTILVDLAQTSLENFSPWPIPVCPDLTSLGLCCTSLNNHSLSKLIRSFPNVVHLDVAQNKNLTDEDVLLIVMQWPSLQSLNIESCTRLTDDSLVHIYTHCAGNLHTLQMNCQREANTNELVEFAIAPFFSSAVICELLEKCTQLRTFHIRGSVHNDGDIRLPFLALRNITTLILGGYVHVENITTSNASLMMLQTLATTSRHPWINLFNLVNGCPNLNEVYLNTYDSEEETVLKLNALKTIRPEVEISSTYFWDKCQKHFVMNM